MDELKLKPKMKDFHKRIEIKHIDKNNKEYYTFLKMDKNKGKLEWVQEVDGFQTSLGNSIK